jgi:hypothetical protein
MPAVEAVELGKALAVLVWTIVALCNAYDPRQRLPKIVEDPVKKVLARRC